MLLEGQSMPINPTRVAVYARVSTNGQTVANQVRELQEAAGRHRWEVVSIFTDEGISGAKGRGKRPGLNALLVAVARRDVDVVAVWSVDRLGRSLQDLVGTLAEIQAKGCQLYLHKQGLDTHTPAGRALFQMLGVFAEFEREIIRERINAGLGRARAVGKRLGRRPNHDPRLRASIARMRADGTGILKIAKTLGVGTSLVQRIVREETSPSAR